jgi:hypothetical protein
VATFAATGLGVISSYTYATLLLNQQRGSLGALTPRYRLLGRYSGARLSETPMRALHCWLTGNSASAAGSAVDSGRRAPARILL